MEKLLSEGIDLEKSLLLLPALYYKYMSPEFLKFIPKQILSMICIRNGKKN